MPPPSRLSYFFAALALQAAVGAPLPLARTVLVQLAAAAANRITPAGLGGAAVNARYLTRRGLTAGRAAAAVGICGLAHIVVAAIGIAIFGPGIAVRAAGWFFGGLSAVDMLWVVAALLVAVIARMVNVRTSRSASTLGKSWLGRTAADARTAAGDLVGHPARLATLIVCTAAVKASNLLALYAALWAFDGDVATWRVAVVYLVGATAAEIVPTPAGLGTVDAALIAGLVTTGVSGGATLAAVIVYRLLSFWAPIIPGLVASAMLRRRLALAQRDRRDALRSSAMAVTLQPMPARGHRPVARAEQGRPHRRSGRHGRGPRHCPANHRGDERQPVSRRCASRGAIRVRHR